MLTPLEIAVAVAAAVVAAAGGDTLAATVRMNDVARARRPAVPALVIATVGVIAPPEPTTS